MMHSCDTSNGTYAARCGNAVTGYTTRALSRRSHDKNLTIQGENEFLHHTLASEQADPLLDWDRRPGSLVHTPPRPLLRAYYGPTTIKSPRLFFCQHASLSLVQTGFSLP